MTETPTLHCAPRRNKHVQGFAYISLIIVVAMVGLIAASAIKLGAVLQRSRAEQELLDIGAAFSDALKSYADATPQGMPTQPPSLRELLKDPRFPGTRRHLRKIFVDPMTGKAEWGIVYRDGTAGVLAVYSLSNAKPVKVGNFPARYSGFEGKNQISDWKFTMGMQEKNASSVPLLQQNNVQESQISPAPNLTAPAVAPAPEKDPAPPPDEPDSHSEQAPADAQDKSPAEPV